MRYSETLIEHFHNPRNVGHMADANGIGQIGDPECGDCLRVYIRVEDDRIADISFLCQGCPAAIATSSILTEMARGRTLAEAAEITDVDVARAIGGLPEEKMHCSNLGAWALHAAIICYLHHSGRMRVPELEQAPQRSGPSPEESR